MAAKDIKRTNKAKKKKKKKKMIRQPHHTAPQTEQAVVTLASQPKQTLMPYDENLLERSRTQWQFGDWQSLIKLNRDTLQHHPERAKLALFTAAGHLQTGKSDNTEAKQFIRLAQEWGIDKKLISRVLIAGVHNSLARAAAANNQSQHATRHFEHAIRVGTPGSATRLLTQARVNEQLGQLGLSVFDAKKIIHKPLLPRLSQFSNLDSLKRLISNFILMKSASSTNGGILVELMGLPGVGKTTLLKNFEEIKPTNWLTAINLSKEEFKQPNFSYFRQHIDTEKEIVTFFESCNQRIFNLDILLSKRISAANMLKNSLLKYLWIKENFNNQIVIHDELFMHRFFSSFALSKNLKEHAEWYFENCPIPDAVIILEDSTDSILDRATKRNKSINSFYGLTNDKILDIYQENVKLYEFITNILKSRNVSVFRLKVDIGTDMVNNQLIDAVTR